MYSEDWLQDLYFHGEYEYYCDVCDWEGDLEETRKMLTKLNGIVNMCPNCSTRLSEKEEDEL